MLELNEIRRNVAADVDALIHKYDSIHSLECIVESTLRSLYESDLGNIAAKNLFTIALKNVFNPQKVDSRQSLYYLEQMQQSINITKILIELNDQEEYFSQYI